MRISRFLIVVVLPFLFACAASTDWNNPCDKGGSNYNVTECAKKQQGGGSQATGVPSIPSGLTATSVSSAQINLSWTDNSNNEIGFIIERKTGTAGTYDAMGNVSANVTSFQDTTVTCATTYYYRVKANNSEGDSSYSNEANVTTGACFLTIPAAPAGLTAYPGSLSSEVDLAWQDNSNNEDGFKIERKTGSGGTYSLVYTAGPNVTSYTDTGLSSSTAYYYRVSADNSAGNSGYSDEANATTRSFSIQTAAIPAGCFNMGDAFSEGRADELPVHNVCLSAFKMNVYEVTNVQYKACVDAASCTAPGDSSSNTRSSYYGNATYDNYPVIYVDWDQSKSFCQWTGGRLPTEAEWEYAARGGLAGKRYPWGDTAPICTLGAINGAQRGACSPDDTIAAGSFAPNGYGLYDMAGNVWEWVNDWYSDTYYSSSPTQDPQGPSSGSVRVLRGGCWGIYDPNNIRASVRGSNVQTYEWKYYGFRCVR
ncbi:MAG: SUMF1/EgtB/PvdO family nonheme iron enzyme [bacterium]|nr:SUMF1/EgtB/PvdO family nonheme iron enzyme [bacterium]